MPDIHSPSISSVFSANAKAMLPVTITKILVKKIISLSAASFIMNLRIISSETVTPDARRNESAVDIIAAIIATRIITAAFELRMLKRKP